MNKLFIILLAIGLASAHTFVKRDAPAVASTENYLDTIQNHLKEFKDNVGSAFNPDALKKGFNDFVDKISNAAKNLKPEENKQ